jgi:hypothetical protein
MKKKLIYECSSELCVEGNRKMDEYRVEALWWRLYCTGEGHLGLNNNYGKPF